MNWKLTFALFAVLVGLGTFYAFVERDQPDSAAMKQRSKSLFSDLKPDDFMRITITRPRDPSATAIVLARAGKRDRWRIDAPLEAEAEQADCDGILTTLELLERKQTVEKTDPKALGLDPARVRVELGRTTATADPAPLVVLFGEEDVTGKSVFVEVEPAHDIALVPSYALGRVDHRADDFRDKSVFSIDKLNVNHVVARVRQKTEALGLKRVNERWLLASADDDIADRASVDALLATAAGLRVKTFVVSSTADATLAIYGLRPSARASVTLETDDASQTLEIGDPVPGDADAVYARRTDRADVITVEKRIVDDLLDLDLARWRSKLLLAPMRDAVEALDIRAPGAPLERATRIERRPGEPWRFASPRTATADAVTTDDLIRALEDVEVAAVASPKIESAANFGLDDRRALVVTLETPREKQAFRLGKASMRPDGVYVERDGKDAALDVVLPRASALRAAWPLLRDRALVTASGLDVGRIDLDHGKGARPFARGPNGWSTPEGKADIASLERLAADLATLRAEKILATPDALATIGLDHPWLKATVSFVKPEMPGLVLELGKVTSAGDAFHAFFKRGDDALVVTLRRELVDELDTDHLATATPPAAPAPGGEPAAPTPTTTTAPAGGQ